VVSIDDFAAILLEEAKRFLEMAKDSDRDQNEPGCHAHLHAAVMLSFCALEAHVNAVADEMSLTQGLSIHEKAILQEKEVKLEEGKFKLKKELKIFRLEDRILFLHARFSGEPLDKTSWMPALKDAIHIRNQLTHPKDVTALTITQVSASITSVIEAIDALYQAIYKKSFPAKARGLQSKLTF
jgi:hypothetical protein